MADDGVANAAQADLVSRLLFGHARAPHLTRLERNSSETLRTISMSIDQVVSGIIGSSVSLISNSAVMVAVLLGLVLSSPIVAVTVTVYFGASGSIWVRGVRGQAAVARTGRPGASAEERSGSILQGIAAAKELQLRGRALFYADEAVVRTRSINAASRGLGVVNGSLRYVLEATLVVGALLIVGSAELVGGRSASCPPSASCSPPPSGFSRRSTRCSSSSTQVQYNGPAIDLVEDEVRDLRTSTPRAGPPPELRRPPLPLRDAVRLEEVRFPLPDPRRARVRNVSLTIGAGESIGIVGPTGSGKSTLLDIILGFLPPDSGSVTVDGAPMQGLP